MSRARTEERRALGPRTRVAAAAGRVLGHLSHAAGLGSGTVVGGIVAELIEPRALERLAAGRVCALVTGTNGKSTTSRMLTAALATEGPVAHNAAGSNMVEGLVMTLASAPDAPTAVLELDEAVLGPISQRLRPDMIVLLNLSREYTRGVLLRRILADWEAAIDAIDWPCSVVANADDPLTVAAARHGRQVTWVSAGLPWTRDSGVCPVCLAPLDVGPSDWACAACDLARPHPMWALDGGFLHGPDTDLELSLAAPGRWNLPNAAFAIAAAANVGVQPAASAAAIADVLDVGGRYVPRPVAGREARLFLVKNPSSWLEAVSLASSGGSVLIALEPFGIKDMAPQWDVDMLPLAGVPVAVAGQRRLDMAVLLEHYRVPHRLFATVDEAAASLPPGPVSIICNYTAFLDLKRRLQH